MASANIENISNYSDHDIPGLRGLVGNNLDSTITDGAGSNLLDGGIGADKLVGGAGNDTYVIDNTGDTVTEAAATGGVDWVQSSVSYALSANVENLALTGIANLNGTGNDGFDNILADNAGNNTLDGKGGNDTLTGGYGVDRLTGGAGNDVFAYLHGTGEAGGGDTGLGLGMRDIITDFTPGTDKIDLSALDADPSTAGVEHWTFVSSFSGTGPEALLNKSDAAHPVLSFDYGDTKVDFQIELAGVAAVTADDFIFS